MSLAQAYVGSQMVADTEQDIIERWCNGDKRAFEELVKRYMTEAYLTALGFARNPEDARDLSQEAFVKAYRARKRFDPKRPFYPWFYRILKNHCLNFVQRRRHSEPLYYDENLDSERFKSSQVTPLEALEKKEQIERVRNAIDRLSLDHREVIILKNFEGRSYREMAEMLEVPIGTIMSRLFYARKALKDIIEGNERGENDRSGSDLGPKSGEVL
jgi:RNA polymerase sigma-70 factor (ECF subfamily)